MHGIPRTKTTIIGLLRAVGMVVLWLGMCDHAQAQLKWHQKGYKNMPHYEDKVIHFGITLGLNTSNFRAVRSEAFHQHDSIMAVESPRGPGFNLGIISDLHLGSYFDLRFIPTLSFAEKQLSFQRHNGNRVNKLVESTYVDFPLHFKFKSDRLNNFRVYVIGGGKYALDLAANAEAREADDKIKIQMADMALEYGIGFDIFFPMFKFSPEIKFSHGVINVHAPDNNLVYSRMIDGLYSHTVLFSLHFE